MFVTSHILGSGINWKWAYTPFMNQVKAGQDPDMQGFIRGIYCFGTKIPQDSAAHMIGRSHDFVDNLYKQARFVTAWKEFQKNEQMTFEPGILEIDSCRTATQKKKVNKKHLKAQAKAALKRPAHAGGMKKPGAKVQVHGGRFLVAVSRKRKQSAFFPLPDRPTSSGAPGPPETAEEVLPILKNKVNRKWHIFGSDASKGLKGARKHLEVEAATARHSLSEYTPLQKLKTKSLPYKALKGMGLKTFKKKGGQLLMVGGDQVAESHTANLKKQLRRNNKLSGLSLKTAHVDGLSSLYVHSNLGLECVLDAYASYMQKMLDQLNPNKMFQNVDWLKPPAQ